MPAWLQWLVWGPILFGFLACVFAGVYALFQTFFGKD